MRLIIIDSFRCAGENVDKIKVEEFCPLEVWYFFFVLVFVLT